ncbi:PKD-like family lipoprotein [Chitinophaga eiseniae]|uniref:PKD-like family protein n=1 Tax=Chitinophaga eiseniae TaxID=634771 RepID=A0A847SBA5_9BACT|nr:PKD-like family lipoprotein [Chitinophaga eiseniae]NLR79091.1 hypothetical protein [Chitinophaga eiseniae]
MRRHIFSDVLWLCVVAIVAFSCQRDKQNYVFEKLNKVSISPDSAFAITQYDTLKFAPVYTDTKPPGVPYKYEWVIYLQNGSGSPVTLSAERNLKAAIKQSPGVYTLQCRVTDPETGIVAVKLYKVTVNGKFYSGWMVANTRNNSAHLDFIRVDDALILDPAGLANNTTYSGKAIAALSTNNSGTAIILFFTTNGVFRFNGNDFFQNAGTDKLLPGASAFSTLPAYSLNVLASEQLLISEGGLYGGISTGFGMTEAQALKPFSDRYNGDYYLFPGLAASSFYTTYVYDNKYKRFMQTGYDTRTLLPSAVNGSFDMGNVGKTAIGFDRGALDNAYPTGEYFFIMQDENNNRYVYSINKDAPAMNQLIGNSPEIGTAKYFATASSLKQLYYATDSKIYLYDMIANSSELLYTFPAGYKIADIKIQRTGTARLVVAANKGTAGEVFYFELNVRGRLVNETFSKKFQGFGEIVQVGFKN